MEEQLMNDMDWEQADKETIQTLTIDLEAAYKQIRDLAEVIGSQNAFIASMKQRFADHGIAILEKSICELSREELVALNKSIPKIRFARADSPDKVKRATYEQQEKSNQVVAVEKSEEGLSKIMDIVTDYGRVDLEKYGIDPKTLNFKEGWGPNGKIVKPSFFQKLIRFFLT
jgi:predicted nuclease with TOPRIM domain